MNFTMCPLCTGHCGYWSYHDNCFYFKITRAFDNELTFFFAIFMSLWGQCFIPGASFLPQGPVFYPGGQFSTPGASVLPWGQYSTPGAQCSTLGISVLPRGYYVLLWGFTIRAMSGYKHPHQFLESGYAICPQIFLPQLTIYFLSTLEMYQIKLWLGLSDTVLKGLIALLQNPYMALRGLLGGWKGRK